jgi:hypothetical protein
MIFDNHDRPLAVLGVAIMIAVKQPCSDLSQIARPDWLTAQPTERLRAGSPAIHPNEIHVHSPVERSLRLLSGGFKKPA